MKKIVHYFRVLILIFLASSFLCGCGEDLNYCKSGDSYFRKMPMPEFGIEGFISVIVMPRNGYESEFFRFNFVLGIVYEDREIMEIFDSYYSGTPYFSNFILQDVDNDGENELIIVANEGVGSETKNVINIYRHFPESEFNEPHFLAIDKPIRFFSQEYEFKDGKLIIKNEGNYKNGKPIPTRVYRIERYKIVMESGDEDWRNEYFFLRPPRKESEWLELKKKYDKIKQESSQ